MTTKLRALRPEQADVGAAPDLPEAERRLSDCLRSLPLQALVVDYGCYGWQAARLGAAIGRRDLRHLGVDLYSEPPGRPPEARFLQLSAIGAPLPALDADLVIATHVIEHCQDAVAVCGTLLAAVKPGAVVYLEAPSEQTALLPSDSDVEAHAFTSFWDDPTHVRPWPLAALYRLGLSWGARPEALCHADRGGIHCSTGLLRRIDPGPPRYRYVSLAGVGRGVEAALAHVNQPAQSPD